MNDLSPEDLKLVTLARAARSRISAEQGVAVRDETGRTYASANVEKLALSALQLTIGQALASGARHIESVVVCSDTDISAHDLEVISLAALSPVTIYRVSLTGDSVTQVVSG